MNRTLVILHLLTLFAIHGQSQENGPDSVTTMTVAATPKMCSCQLIEVQTHNDKKLHVGIFAEKDLQLKKRNSFHAMDAMIRKEKSYLQRGFVDDVKVLSSHKSHTDCMTLYAYLKKQNKKFRMCDIINVDALLAINRR
jgi:hypothetical protein